MVAQSLGERVENARKHLEPDAPKVGQGTESIIAASSAISLKRIAESLEFFRDLAEKELKGRDDATR